MLWLLQGNPFKCIDSDKQFKTGEGFLLFLLFFIFYFLKKPSYSSLGHLFIQIDSAHHFDTKIVPQQ